MLTPIQIPTGSPILSLPQGAAGQSQQQSLPLQPGSLMPVKILQQDQGVATLMLGQFRMQAKLPAQLPPGNLWVLLVDGGKPPQMRLLSESQAADILASRLAEAAASSAGKQGAQMVRPQQEWPMPQQAQSGQQQYLFHPAGNGNMLMIDDPEDQSPRGAMEREADENGFTLHGRLDLESLGRLHFALRKLGELPLQIDLRAADHATFVELQQPFSEWLAGQRQQEKGSELNGYLSEGSTPIVQPKRSAGTTA